MRGLRIAIARSRVAKNCLYCSNTNNLAKVFGFPYSFRRNLIRLGRLSIVRFKNDNISCCFQRNSSVKSRQLFTIWRNLAILQAISNRHRRPKWHKFKNVAVQNLHYGILLAVPVRQISFVKRACKLRLRPISQGDVSTESLSVTREVLFVACRLVCLAFSFHA